MPHTTRSTFSVRSYEIDSYSHLNNGVYVAWFEQGRLDHLLSLGFSYDGFAARQEWFVVRRTEVDFRYPLCLGEAVRLTSHVEGLGRTSVRYRQVMHLLPPDGSPGKDAPKVVAEALSIMVFAGPDGTAIPIPADLAAALAEADARADLERPAD